MSLLKATKLHLHVIFALLYSGLLITCKHFMQFCGLITLQSKSLMLFKNRDFIGQRVLTLTEKFDNF